MIMAFGSITGWRVRISRSSMRQNETTGASARRRDRNRNWEMLGRGDLQPMRPPKGSRPPGDHALSTPTVGTNLKHAWTLPYSPWTATTAKIGLIAPNGRPRAVRSQRLPNRPYCDVQKLDEGVWTQKTSSEVSGARTSFRLDDNDFVALRDE